MFSASEEKVKKGFKFQEKMLKYLRNRFECVRDSREYIKTKKPGMPDVVYNVFESKNGDMIINPDGDSIHVECVTTAHRSIFPQTKIKNFHGENHYYAFQLDDTGEIFFVHSLVWNKYISQCPVVSIKGNKYRKFGIKNLRNLRSKINLIEFIKSNGGKFDGHTQ